MGRFQRIVAYRMPKAKHCVILLLVLIGIGYVRTETAFSLRHKLEKFKADRASAETVKCWLECRRYSWTEYYDNKKHRHITGYVENSWFRRSNLLFNIEFELDDIVADFETEEMQMPM